jgi:CRISPR-associated protein Cas5d
MCERRKEMDHPNIVEFKVSAKYALFSDPITRVGGEKFTYQIPTYQALKGILESVYWKPTFIWYIDAVRVMKPIQTQSSGIRTLKYSDGKSDLSIYTYLSDVEYQVRAHFEWNENRPELSKDRNENKHHNVAKRMIERGGRRDIFLGTRECQGYVEPCTFGEGESDYDGREEVQFGLMFHGFTYPDEAAFEDEKNKLFARFWRPKMKNGIVTFQRPEACEKRFVKTMSMKPFGEDNFCGLDEFVGKEEEYGLD